MQLPKTCVISLGINGPLPPDHPRIIYQRFELGVARIKQTLEQLNFEGDFLGWDSEYPEGSPREREAHGAFKPFCFREAQERGYDVVLWLDASIRIKRPLAPLFGLIEKDGYLFFQEDHSVGEYCKDAALEPLGITREESLTMPCCWSCVVGLNLAMDRPQEFLRQWLERAADGVTFPGPKWSGVRGWPRTASADPRVKGHRHDQTAASVIALQLGMTNWQSKQTFSCFFENERRFVRRLQEDF